MKKSGIYLMLVAAGVFYLPLISCLGKKTADIALEEKEPSFANLSERFE